MLSIVSFDSWTTQRWTSWKNIGCYSKRETTETTVSNVKKYNATNILLPSVCTVWVKKSPLRFS